ncbi:MAG: Gfo/Idh/MocA family oxidoreductase [Oscillospiraceae bacterium]|nr:Gfo/Idh/MocA family oxidoreductase [Oscillospiraceae bacterium]
MKIGILGAGRIAASTAPAMIALQEVECYAVASRSLERAQHFAQQFGFQKAYGSYEQMLEDPDVELVYIATPHSHHFEQMMLCMRYGKAVLCEKAFTMNAAQARAVQDYSREHGIFAAEAIWPRYMPSRAIIDDVIASGVIGTPNTLTANLSYVIHQDHRIVNPWLAGGALLDIGVYGINFALMHFGTEIERVESSVKMMETGVDGMETITIFYKDGRMAVLTHSVYARSDRKGIIHGDRGYIVVENINNPQSVSVFDTDDRLIAFYPVPEQINGYEYEFLECAEALRCGRTESWSMPLADSVYVMEFMDALRNQWGMVFPQERVHEKATDCGNR